MSKLELVTFMFIMTLSNLLKDSPIDFYKLVPAHQLRTAVRTSVYGNQAVMLPGPSHDIK